MFMYLFIYVCLKYQLQNMKYYKCCMKPILFSPKLHVTKLHNYVYILAWLTKEVEYVETNYTLTENVINYTRFPCYILQSVFIWICIFYMWFYYFCKIQFCLVLIFLQ